MRLLSTIPFACGRLAVRFGMFRPAMLVALVAVLPITVLGQTPAAVVLKSPGQVQIRAADGSIRKAMPGRTIYQGEELLVDSQTLVLRVRSNGSLVVIESPQGSSRTIKMTDEGLATAEGVKIVAAKGSKGQMLASMSGELLADYQNVGGIVVARGGGGMQFQPFNHQLVIDERPSFQWRTHQAYDQYRISLFQLPLPKIDSERTPLWTKVVDGTKATYDGQASLTGSQQQNYLWIVDGISDDGSFDNLYVGEFKTGNAEQRELGAEWVALGESDDVALQTMAAYRLGEMRVYDHAVQVFEKLLDQPELDSTTLKYIAFLYGYLGETDKAKEILQRALQASDEPALETPKTR